MSSLNSMWKNVSFLKKILFFRSQCKKILKIENWLENVFLRIFRRFDSQFYIFFEKLRLFYIRHVIFRLGFARVHNDFFFKAISAYFCWIPHSTQYCRNMSGIFSIFHCKWNIVATFLSNIPKYFIAILQF